MPEKIEPPKLRLVTPSLEARRSPISVLSKAGFQWTSLVWLLPISATLFSIYLVVKYF